MCNSISEIYSLYNDSRDLFKGNLTKIPEVVLESNNILHALGNSKLKLGKNVKNSYDIFIKNGFQKTEKYTDVNLDTVSFVAGFANSYLSSDKGKKEKFSAIGSFLCGFGAKLAIEGVMNCKYGSNLLQKTSSLFANIASVPLSFFSKNTEKFKSVGAYIISGLLFQLISDKVSEKVEDFAHDFMTKRGEKQ